MGRGLVIICIGMVFIFGIIQLSIVNRQVASTNINIDSASRAQARNFAISGLELAILNLNESTWQPDQTYIHEFDGSPVSMEITDLGSNEVTVRSTGTVNGRNATALANLRLNTGGNMPQVNAAISVLGDDFEIRANSAAWRIDGRNTLIGSTSGGSGGGTHLPGIIATPDAYSSIYSSTSGRGRSRHGQIQGLAGVGSPNMIAQAADPDYVASINQFMVAAVGSSAAVTFGNSNNSSMQLGTEANPQITVIDGNAKFTGGVTGTGVIIVKEGSKLDVGGNFRFNGLVIVEGTMAASGTPHIWGGIIYTDKHEYNENESMLANGTPKFYYSKQALDIVQNNLNSVMGSGYVLLGIYD